MEPKLQDDWSFCCEYLYCGFLVCDIMYEVNSVPEEHATSTFSTESIYTAKVKAVCSSETLYPHARRHSVIIHKIVYDPECQISVGGPKCHLGIIVNKVVMPVIKSRQSVS